jgi:cell fate (sporulation/competence/biofilm development) regulator YlbF (YheA/YmcA/DUF963 family)
METKTCSKCGKQKDVIEFSKHKLGKNGLRPHCKLCATKQDKVLREKYAESVKICCENKLCSRCDILHPITLFRKNKCNKDGYSRYCKNCDNEYNKLFNSIDGYQQNQHEKREINGKSKAYRQTEKYKINQRRYTLKRCFGITVYEYEEMYKSQNGKCNICGKEETSYDKKQGVLRRLSVDHDHKTGKVRGLLCSNCNLAIGKMNEDISILKSAIEYLEKYNGGDQKEIHMLLTNSV